MKYTFEFVELRNKQTLNEEVPQRPSVGTTAPPIPGSTTAAQAAISGAGTQLRSYDTGSSISDIVAQAQARRAERNAAFEANRTRPAGSVQPTSSPNATAPAQSGVSKAQTIINNANSTLAGIKSNRRDVQRQYGTGGRQNVNAAPNTQAKAPAPNVAAKKSATPSYGDEFSAPARPNTQAKAPTPNVAAKKPAPATNATRSSAPSYGNEFDAPGYQTSQSKINTFQQEVSKITGIQPGQFSRLQSYYEPEISDDLITQTVKDRSTNTVNVGAEVANRRQQQATNAAASAPSSAPSQAQASSAVTGSAADVRTNTNVSRNGNQSVSVDLSGSQTVQSGYAAQQTAQAEIDSLRRDAEMVQQAAVSTGPLATRPNAAIVRSGDVESVVRDSFAQGTGTAIANQQSRSQARVVGNVQGQALNARENIRQALVRQSQTSERRSQLGIAGPGEEGYISSRQYEAYKKLMAGGADPATGLPLETQPFGQYNVNANRQAMGLEPLGLSVDMDQAEKLFEPGQQYMGREELKRFMAPFADQPMSARMNPTNMQSIEGLTSTRQNVFADNVYRPGQASAPMTIGQAAANPEAFADARYYAQMAFNDSAQMGIHVPVLGDITSPGFAASVTGVPGVARASGATIATALTGGLNQAPKATGAISKRLAGRLGAGAERAEKIGKTVAGLTPGAKVATGASAGASITAGGYSGLDAAQNYAKDYTGLELSKVDILTAAGETLPGVNRVIGQDSIPAKGSELAGALRTKEFRDTVVTPAAARAADVPGRIGGPVANMVNRIPGVNIEFDSKAYADQIAKQGEELASMIGYDRPTGAQDAAEAGLLGTTFGSNVLSNLSQEQIEQLPQQSPIRQLFYNPEGGLIHRDEVQRRLEGFVAASREGLDQAGAIQSAINSSMESTQSYVDAYNDVTDAVEKPSVTPTADDAGNVTGATVDRGSFDVETLNKERDNVQRRVRSDTGEGGLLDQFMEPIEAIADAAALTDSEVDALKYDMGSERIASEIRTRVADPSGPMGLAAGGEENPFFKAFQNFRKGTLFK